MKQNISEYQEIVNLERQIKAIVSQEPASPERLRKIMPLSNRVSDIERAQYYRRLRQMMKNI